MNGITGLCDSPKISVSAPFFFTARTKASMSKHCSPTPKREVLRCQLLGMTLLHGRRGRLFYSIALPKILFAIVWVKHPLIVNNSDVLHQHCGFTDYSRDPAAGSPTATLLRLLLPPTKGHWPNLTSIAPKDEMASPPVSILA